jgi:RHS repeat-associated protein
VDYYPYGGEENDYCGTRVARHSKFTGKECDVESGLDNFGARYDASSLSRFMGL